MEDSIRRAAGKVDNTIIYHHRKVGIGDDVNPIVGWDIFHGSKHGV
jgi:hypothetical protein